MAFSARDTKIHAHAATVNGCCDEIEIIIDDHNPSSAMVKELRDCLDALREAANGIHDELLKGDA